MAGREKVNGGIKKMKPREKWICWELSKEDIDRTARRVGVNTGSFREGEQATMGGNLGGCC